MQGRRLAAALAFVAIAGSVPIAIAIGGTGEPPAPVEIASNVTDRPARPTADKLVCTPAEKPANFRLYSLGTRFAGLPLTAVLRTCGNPQPVPGDNPKLPATYRSNSVTYIYGDCTPPAGEGGCAAPIQLQISPACERNVAQYERRPKLTRRRGVPSAALDRALELYTADSTVVIFTGDRHLMRRAVSAVQRVRRGDAPAVVPPILKVAKRLPPPVHGAIAGKLRCDRPARRGFPLED
jgi:hypothetical protein